MIQKNMEEYIMFTMKKSKSNEEHDEVVLWIEHMNEVINQRRRQQLLRRKSKMHINAYYIYMLQAIENLYMT